MNEPVGWNDVLKVRQSITSARLTIEESDKHAVGVFFITLGKLCVKSTQGLMSTAPAGSSMPKSRMTVSTVRHRPALVLRTLLEKRNPRTASRKTRVTRSTNPRIKKHLGNRPPRLRSPLRILQVVPTRVHPMERQSTPIVIRF